MVAAFAIVASALAVLALGFVLRPLWRAKPLAGFGLCAVLVAAAALVYGMVGNPRALDPAQLQPPRTLADAIEQMQVELARDPGRNDPDQAEGWRLLARAYGAEGRAVDARDAFARAAQLQPNNPDVLVEAAEASALADPQRRFDDAAVAQLQRAVQVQPPHQRARWFLGIAQRQRGDDAAAAQTWEPLLALVDAGTAASLRPQIDAARAAAGLPPLPVAAAPAATTPAIEGPSLRLTVSLAPNLAQRLPAGASLYVIAKQPGGAPMPVAVEKRAVDAFPAEIALDDGDSPMPTLTLSQVERVEITARISASGDAIARPGDFESAPVVVDTASTAPVAITIDRVVE